MLDDFLNQGQLNVRWICNVQFLSPTLGNELYGIVGEDREADLALIADDLDAVGLRGFVRTEAPGPAARQAIGELERCADGVLCLVETCTIAAVAVSSQNGSKELLQKVQLMGSQVIEISSSCDIPLHTPGQLSPVVVEVARRYSETNLNAHNLANLSFLHDLLHSLEIRKITPIVRHETGHARLFGHTADTQTLFIGGSQRLLHVHGFTGLHGHDGIRGVGRRRRGDVNGIHLRVVQQRLSVRVPAGYAVAVGVALGTFGIAPHDGNNRGARH